MNLSPWVVLTCLYLALVTILFGTFTTGFLVVSTLLHLPSIPTLATIAAALPRILSMSAGAALPLAIYLMFNPWEL